MVFCSKLTWLLFKIPLGYCTAIQAFQETTRVCETQTSSGFSRQSRHSGPSHGYWPHHLPSKFVSSLLLRARIAQTLKLLQDFTWKDDLCDDLFTVPSDYVEDPTRFPELWRFEDLGMISFEGSKSKTKRSFHDIKRLIHTVLLVVPISPVVGQGRTHFVYFTLVI